MNMKKEEGKIKEEFKKLEGKLKNLKDEDLKKYHKEAVKKEEPEAIELAQKEMTSRGIFW